MTPEQLNDPKYEENDGIKIEPNFLETVRYGKFISHTLQGTAPQTAGNYGIIFIARHPIEIMRISEVHTAAGTDAGAVTLDVKKASSGTAIASGTTLLASTFSLKSTADTPIVKEGVGLASDRILKENDRIGLVVSGTLTDLSDVCITIYYKELNQGYIR
jgi:hypothetical protein